MTKPKSTIDFDTVRDIGLALPGVEESTAYGSPVLKVHGELMAGIAANRSAEPGSLIVRVDFDDRAELTREDTHFYAQLTGQAKFEIFSRSRA